MLTPTDIRAILFDFDGTLWDSEAAGLSSWEEAYSAFGVEFPFESYVSRLGTIGGTDPLTELERTLGHEIDRTAITKQRLRRKHQLLSELSPRAGVISYISEARRRGLRVAIVSSDDSAYIEAGLRMMGLQADWSVIACAEGDAARAKPSPVLYLDALDRLKLGPNEAIAIEDSPNGIAAAKKAGIFCVAVPNSVTLRLDLSQADLVVSGLDQLPLDALLDRIQADDSAEPRGS